MATDCWIDENLLQKIERSVNHCLVNRASTVLSNKNNQMKPRKNLIVKHNTSVDHSCSVLCMILFFNYLWNDITTTDASQNLKNRMKVIMKILTKTQER